MPLYGFKAPTVQKFTSGSGTYTTPAGVRYLKVKMIGGGAAGFSGSGGGSPVAPGDTTFGALTAGGGAGSVSGASSGFSAVGGLGSSVYNGGSPNIMGGHGGVSPFGGAGQGGVISSGTTATSNTGSGGGGAAWQAGSGQPGYGGAAGSYLETIITSPSATYSYGVGAGGTPGSANSLGYSGGAGGSGVIIVEEFY